MKTALQKSFELTRRMAVVALGLWLAGVSCALCCADVMAALAASGPVTAARREAPAARPSASASKSCHAHAGKRTTVGAGAAFKSHARRAESASLAAGNEAGFRCPKTRQPSDPARKLRPEPERAASVAASFFDERAGRFASAALTEPRGRLPDGQGSHVLRCVFLI